MRRRALFIESITIYVFSILNLSLYINQRTFYVVLPLFALMMNSQDILGFIWLRYPLQFITTSWHHLLSGRLASMTTKIMPSSHTHKHQQTQMHTNTIVFFLPIFPNATFRKYLAWKTPSLSCIYALAPPFPLYFS